MITTILTILSIVGYSFAQVEIMRELFGDNLGKPFGCSSCTSFWVGLITACITGNVHLIFVPYLVSKIILKYLWN